MENILINLFFIILAVQADYIGLQSGPQKSVDVFDTFIPPDQFFTKYVIPGTPVLFRGAAKTFPAFTKWTDEYFQSLPESDTFTVFAEEGKKENRNDGSKHLTFSEFLNVYKEEDIYYVNPVPPFLASDIPLHLPLNCPFVVNNLLADNVMWFSSGGTKSVWHNDAYENINCLMRGKKWFIMANRSETHQKAHIDNREGSYSSVDVENVDTDKYPGFKDIQFYNVSMEAGDCLYIPWFWFHHVNSIGSNLAVNIWWRSYRSPLVCEDKTQLTLDQLHFRDGDENDDGDMPLSEAAHQMIYMHDRMYTEETIDWPGFLECVGPALDERGMHHITDADIRRLFKLLDSDEDELLNYVEIDNILTVFPKFLRQFKDEL